MIWKPAAILGILGMLGSGPKTWAFSSPLTSRFKAGASMERHPMATEVLPTHNDKSDESVDLLGQWVHKAGQWTGPN